MSKLRLGAVAMLLAAWPQGSVLANDSVAALGAGGLELTETADIRMASEDLFISRDIVRVRYSFANESGKPITARVAFPLPEVEFWYYWEESPFGLPSGRQGTFLDFKIIVDGKAVTPELEHRAFHKGADVTDTLRRLGVPFTYDSDTFKAVMAKLPGEALEELKASGLWTADGPAWTLKSIFHWQQTFPADRPLKVTHEYKPITGGFYITSEMYDLNPQSLTQISAWCIDKATNAGIVKRLRAPQSPILSFYYVDYVLTTGRNWKGSIGTFRLTLDKGSPDNLVSLCMNGVSKTGPTTFVIERKDFVPEKDLSVLFIVPERR